MEKIEPLKWRWKRNPLPVVYERNAHFGRSEKAAWRRKKRKTADVSKESRGKEKQARMKAVLRRAALILQSYLDKNVTKKNR